MSKTRVLLVDDVASVRLSIEVALKVAGFEVTSAGNGTEGQRLAESETFDVLVTDIWMPEGNGLQLIKRLREANSAIRIFAISGGGPKLTLETVTTFAELWGAERVFLKPFHEDDLIAAIRDLRPVTA
jgi:two-component system, chemotaxis family, chemotaxis protein CheY